MTDVVSNPNLPAYETLDEADRELVHSSKFTLEQVDQCLL